MTSERINPVDNTCFWSLEKKSGQEIEMCELCANRLLIEIVG